MLGLTPGAALFREPTVGRSISPVRRGAPLVLLPVRPRLRPQRRGPSEAAARNLHPLRRGAARPYLPHGPAQVGLRAMWRASRLRCPGGTLNWWPSAGPPGLWWAQISVVHCPRPLRPAHGGLVINLLFQVPGPRRPGRLSPPPWPARKLFGGVFYLAALQAQGIHLRRLFRSVLKLFLQTSRSGAMMWRKLEKGADVWEFDWNRRRGHHGGHRRPACEGLLAQEGRCTVAAAAALEAAGGCASARA